MPAFAAFFAGAFVTLAVLVAVALDSYRFIHK
jgi:hypothetical protein